MCSHQITNKLQTNYTIVIIIIILVSNEHAFPTLKQTVTFVLVLISNVYRQGYSWYRAMETKGNADSVSVRQVKVF